MYENPGMVYAGMQRPSVSLQPTSLENALYGAGSDLIQSELGAYGEKLMESSSAYVQSNISKYFADPQYYFQVNDQYVKNKLKVLLFPFLHKGHWTRTTEPVNGKLSYKPPIYDINAPDLYIPLMAFGTYVVLAGFSLGLNGKFSPDALSVQFSNGLLVWLLEVLLLKATLNLLGNGEAPLLDICAYGGYVFTNIASAVLARILSSSLYYAVVIWEGFCMAVFLVKTMKRVLFVEMKCYENNSFQRNYVLLFVAAVQFPLLFCISNISAR